MKNILIVIDNLERFDFFSKVFQDLNQDEYKVTYLTNKFSVSRKIKKENCLFLKSKVVTKAEINSECDIKIESSLEFATGKIQDKSRIENIVNSWSHQLENIKLNFDYVIIWNGTRALERLVSSLQHKNLIPFEKSKLIYCEISNINNKLFLDPKGVNAESLLYKDFDIIQEEHTKRVNSLDVVEWKKNYKNKKLRQVDVPQSKNARKLNFVDVFDYVLSKFGFSFYPMGLYHTFKMSMGRLMSKSIIKKSSENNILSSNYIFIPLQVNNDSQIKFNSNGMDNFKLVEHINANYEENDVVFKLHPSENDYFSIRNLVKLIKKNPKAIISNDNTFSLIENSKMVVTINSTVGLEAKILDRETIFLGKSLYSKIVDDDCFDFYINSWLLEVDYFSPQPNSNGFIKKVDEIYAIYERL